MSNDVRSIMDALYANPQAHARAIELALESKDETKNYHSRMTVVDYSETSWTLTNYK